MMQTFLVAFVGLTSLSACGLKLNVNGEEVVVGSRSAGGAPERIRHDLFEAHYDLAAQNFDAAISAAERGDVREFSLRRDSYICSVADGAPELKSACDYLRSITPRTAPGEAPDTTIERCRAEAEHEGSLINEAFREDQVRSVNSRCIARERAEQEAKAAAQRRRREEEDARAADAKRKADELKRASAEDDQAWEHAESSSCRTAVQASACDAVRGYLTKFSSGRHAAEAQEVLRIAEPLLKKIADDHAWQDADGAACQSAIQASACDGVRGYVAKFTSGRHAADAQQALRVAEPLLAKIVDEDDWKAADVEKCRKPETSSECARVQGYLTKHPDGAHASEATRLLKATGPRLAALLKAEAARAKAEEARQLREQRAKEKAEAEAASRELRDRYLDAQKVLLAKRGGADFVRRGEAGFRVVAGLMAQIQRVQAKFQTECPEQECKAAARLQWYATTFERLNMQVKQAQYQIGAVQNSAVYAGFGGEFNDFYSAGVQCFVPDDSGDAACK